MTLTERVAFRAIDFYLVNQRNIALDKSELIDLADAAIAIVLEEAAKVADAYHNRAMLQAKEASAQGNVILGRPQITSAAIAATIRTLGDKP